MRTPRSLGEVLTAIEPNAGSDNRVSVAQMLTGLGERSFAPLVLVTALLLVSPLSAIPGAPTTGAIIVILITGQWLVGRRHLWLPGFLLRRTVSARRLSRAVRWLRKPAAWFDGHSQGRLRLLTTPPLSMLSKLVIVLTAAGWPLLELVPMITSVGALVVALLTFGLMVRDGLWLAAGYGTLGCSVAVVSWLAMQV